MSRAHFAVTPLSALSWTAVSGNIKENFSNHLHPGKKKKKKNLRPFLALPWQNNGNTVCAVHTAHFCYISNSKSPVQDKNCVYSFCGLRIDTFRGHRCAIYRNCVQHNWYRRYMNRTISSPNRYDSEHLAPTPWSRTA